MKIQHLPVLLPQHPSQYPVTNTERNVTPPLQEKVEKKALQKNSTEEVTLPVKATTQTLVSNRTLQQQTAIAPRTQVQQQSLPHSTQQAVNTYQDIEYRDTDNTSTQVLNRVDVLA